MTPLTKLRPTVRRSVVAVISSVVLLGAAGAAGAPPVVGSHDAGATDVAVKKYKAKTSGRKIT